MVRHQQEPLRDQFRDCAGSYTPQVHAQYGRGDGTFYSSHPNVQDAESKFSHPLLASLCIYTLLGNKDFNASSYHKPEPHGYGYLDAHPVPPALESLPCSSRSPPAEPSQPAPIACKWKDTLPSTSAETTVLIKRVKVKGSGSCGCIRTANFNELTRSIIEEVISIYHAQIGGVEPFPECADDCDSVKQAWLEVCTSCSLRVELEEDIFKLVRQSPFFLSFLCW